MSRQFFRSLKKLLLLQLELSAERRGESALLDQAGDATKHQLQAESDLVDAKDDTEEEQQRAKPADNVVRAQHGEPVEEQDGINRR